MSEATVRSGVYTALAGISDIGKVYDYRRFNANYAEFLNLFKATIDGADQVRGWQISRKSGREDDSSVKTHIFRIEGFFGLSDANATEKTFNALIESVAAAFRANKTLSGAALGHDFIQAAIIEERVFGSVLCHFCELNVTVYDHNP